METVTPTSFSGAALRRLIAGETVAIVIDQFHPSPWCDELANAVTAHGLHYYKNEPRFGFGLGTPFYDTRDNPTEIAEYFDEVAKWEAVQSQLTAHPHPAVVLSELIAQRWAGHGGVRRLRTHAGRPAQASVARIIRNGGAADCHVDVLADDDHLLGLFEHEGVDLQLGVNTYLRMPDDGSGELELWNFRPTASERELFRDPTSKYALQLPEASVAALRPRVGQAIIFANSRGHAVQDSNGDRVTSSFHLGVTKRGLRQWA